MPHASPAWTQTCHILGLLVMALLALLCMPPDAGARQPTGTIPSLDATVTSLRFLRVITRRLSVSKGRIPSASTALRRATCIGS